MEENFVQNEIVDENISSNIIQDNSVEIEMLQTIHNDLGFICCFLVIFVVFILLKYAYKWFDMFFKI